MWELNLEKLENMDAFRWLMVIAMAAGLSMLVQFVLRIVEGRGAKFASRTGARYDDIVLDCIRHTKTWVIFVWIVVPLARISKVEPSAETFLKTLVVIATSVQIGIWGLHMLRGWQDNYLRRRIASDVSSASALNLLGTAAKILFFVALALICMSNLGIDIGALVAGLGIGGIAVALAAQNILGDLFGSLSIVLDKPFVVGDYIVVGNDQGTVEYVGIKTTRVRSLSGEELVFSNKDLLESRIKNFKRMRERRAVLNFSVPFETPLEKLKQVPNWIKGFIEGYDLLRFERSHLAGHGKEGSSSLDFETVYWVKDPDNNKFMDLQQQIYHQLLAKLQEEEMGFALPVQISVGASPDYVFSNEDEEDFDDHNSSSLNN